MSVYVVVRRARRCRRSRRRRSRSAATGTRSRAARCRSTCRGRRSASRRPARRRRSWAATVLAGGAGTTALGALVERVAAGVVRRGHDDHDGVALVVVGERVRGVGGAGDVDAVRAVLVAALPLVGVGDRVGARPGAGRRRSACRPASTPPRDGGRGRVARRRGDDRGASRRRVAVTSPPSLSAVTTTVIGVADVVRARRVGVAVAPGMSAQLVAVGVAALPLVGVVDRRVPVQVPGVGGQRAAVGPGSPVMAGRRGVDRRGGRDRAAVGAEASVVEPPGFVAVTSTTIAWPTSAPAGE